MKVVGTEDGNITSQAPHEKTGIFPRKKSIVINGSSIASGRGRKERVRVREKKEDKQASAHTFLFLLRSAGLKRQTCVLLSKGTVLRETVCGSPIWTQTLKPSLLPGVQLKWQFYSSPILHDRLFSFACYQLQNPCHAVAPRGHSLVRLWRLRRWRSRSGRDLVLQSRRCRGRCPVLWRDLSAVGLPV